MTDLVVFLLAKGFHSSKADPSLFTLHKGSDSVILLLYVGDHLITGVSSTLFTTFLSELKSEFSMKDLGQVHYFLGIEVPTTQGLFLSQHNYATQILKKRCMEDCKHVYSNGI